MKLPPRSSILGVIVSLVVIALTIVFARRAWIRETHSPGSDRAIVNAQTVSIDARVAGPITALAVAQGTHVNAGDLLFTIDSRPFELAVASAEALLNAAVAQVQIETARAEQLQALASAADADIKGAEAAAVERRATATRVQAMAKDGFATAQDVDVAVAAVGAAEALLSAARARAEAAHEGVTEVAAAQATTLALEASLNIAKLERAFCDVRAPVSGTVIALDFAVGTHALPGFPLFRLLVDDTWVVDALIEEGNLHKLRVGDSADVWVMTDSTRQFAAVVESIGIGVRPNDEFNLLGVPVVRRELDWVRVAQRFPVRLRVINPDPTLFRLGASASVIIHPSSAAITGQ